jgi:chemotaxis protein CheD
MASARIGEIVVSCNASEELIALGLGSCIGLVMSDSKAGVAGLAHVMLPDSGPEVKLPGKFADTAVLIEKRTGLGAARPRLRVAIAGGAAMFGASGTFDIGQRNADAVRAALKVAGLRCHAADTGGSQGRTVRVSVGTGATTVRVTGTDPVELLPAGREQRSA